MRRFAVLTSAFVALAFGCATDPEEGNAFQTQGQSTMNAEDSDTGVPDDLPSTGDGDGSPTTGDGDGDGDPTTGDGDGDPTTGDGDGAPGPTCGNGMINPGEQCDGGNLNGFSCIDLGYSGGTLACDPITCTYDASGCVNNPGDGGTTG